MQFLWKCESSLMWTSVSLLACCVLGWGGCSQSVWLLSVYIVLCEIDVFHHRHVGCSAAPCGFHTSMSMSSRSRAFSDGFDCFIGLVGFQVAFLWVKAVFRPVWMLKCTGTDSVWYCAVIFRLFWNYWQLWKKFVFATSEDVRFVSVSLCLCHLLYGWKVDSLCPGHFLVVYMKLLEYVLLFGGQKLGQKGTQLLAWHFEFSIRACQCAVIMLSSHCGWFGLAV